jgi:hypothetical protein
VIALRCVDWMAAARGGLSSESDARASSGQAVRDSQKVTSSIRTAGVTAFQEAKDTLEIDFSLVPVEIDMTYAVFLSYLIEGDWDVTNDDTLRFATQMTFASACEIGWYGDSVFFLNDSDWAQLKSKQRMKDSYSMSTYFTGTIHIGDVVGTEVLHWRAYAQSGTTIELLLDQIILLPYVLSGTHNGWQASDFRAVAGAFSDFSTVLLEDGDDGGDANGKFTWHAYPENDSAEVDWSGDDGGGDFQKKAAYADAEYMIHVIPDDNVGPFEDSQTLDKAPATAYALLGARYREVQTFVSDNFSRTVGSNQWGVGPQGFGYTMHIGTGASASVNGSVGILGSGGPSNSASVGAWLNGSTVSARVAAANMTFSGVATFTSFSAGVDPDRLARLKMGFRRPTDVGGENLWYISIDLLAGSWTLARSGTVAFTSPVDISAWLAEDSPIGFKVEIKRYLMRAKVWDATGAEPVAWDVEVFRPLFVGATWYAYPYAGAGQLLHQVAGILLSPGVINDNRDTGETWESHWDNFLVEYDPYGDPADMSVAIEQPVGTKRAEIDVPFGSDYFVHLGAREWSNFDSFASPDPYMDFSARVWNNPAAAELQRAEAHFWWFRISRFNLVSMNWRSGDRRSGSNRVLVGD